MPFGRLANIAAIQREADTKRWPPNEDEVIWKTALDNLIASAQVTKLKNSFRFARGQPRALFVSFSALHQIDDAEAILQRTIEDCKATRIEKERAA